MKSLFLKKLSVAYIFAIVVFSIGITFIITSYLDKKENEKKIAENLNNCKYDIKRLDGFNFVKPLMFVDDECEGDNLAITKQEITQVIENYKTTQNVSSASVYIKDYYDVSWTSINSDEKFEPGSLFKVPILIAYLKMEEQIPGTLNKELLFKQNFSINKDVAFKSKSIVLGQKYKVSELLKYMISYSDNNATGLLNNNLDLNILIKLFSDLGLKKPDFSAQHYYFTTRQYSLFMRALYNASYLNINNSEFAVKLLSTCEFKEGILKGLPKDVKIAHKFGESGNTQEIQLHESAIVYLKDKPYLITVMTKGKDNKILSKLIADISTITFKNLSNL